MTALKDPIIHRIKIVDSERECRDKLVIKYLEDYKKHNPKATYKTFDDRIQEANPNISKTGWRHLKVDQKIIIPMDIKEAAEVNSITSKGLAPLATTTSIPPSTTNEEAPVEEVPTEQQEASGKPSQAGVYLACNGAKCMCTMSNEQAPYGIFKVESQDKLYINDKEGAKKLLATTMDLPLPFETKAKTFGTCKMQPIVVGVTYNPCTPNIIQWDKSYDAIKIESTGATALTEKSIGICSFGGQVEFKTNGQTETITAADIAATPEEIIAFMTDGLLTPEEISQLAAGTFTDEKGVGVNAINTTDGKTLYHADKKDITFKATKYSSKNPTPTDAEKQGINWVVFHRKGKTENSYEKIHTFTDVGDTFVFPFQIKGVYAVEAYGKSSSFNPEKDKRGSGCAYKIITLANQGINPSQELILKGNNQNRNNKKRIRPTEITTIDVAMLFPDVAPPKQKDLYWEVTSQEGEEIPYTKQETSIVIAPLNNTTTKTITATVSYKETQKSITYTVGTNHVLAIKANKTTVAVCNKGETQKERHKVTLEVSSYAIEPPTAEEEALVKWTAYYENETANKETIIATGSSITQILKKETTIYFEAFANKPQGKNSNCSKAITGIYPKITKAYWANANGNPISKSGFGHNVYIHIETEGLTGEKLQLNVWHAQKGSKKHTETKGSEIEITQNNGVIHQAFTLPDSKTEKEQAAFFFTIDNLCTSVLGAFSHEKINNQHYLMPNGSIKYLEVTSNKKILSLKIYESNGTLHTGIVKYGDTVTVKLETRNLVGEELIFNFYEDINWGFDKKLDETITICVDAEGNGEATFTIPTNDFWEGGHNDDEACTPRYFYLKEKNSSEEFPRAYYVANPNKTEEENKGNSNRIKALMLKVAKDNQFDEATEENNAVILGDELLLEEKDKGNPCEPLLWGSKLTCTERKKVIEIATNLWGEDKKMEMANQLMVCMAVETSNTFDPTIGYSKATGLIQFTEDAINSMNGMRYDGNKKEYHWRGKQYNKGFKFTKEDLIKMNVLEQLDYVELYFKMWMGDFKKTINDALDMYMTIWCPKAVGKEDSFVCYKEGTNTYTKNKSIDGERYDEKAQKIFKTTGNGEITKGELRPRIKMAEATGFAKRNKCKTDTSTCEFGTSKGKQTDTGIWRDPIDNPQITIYTAGGNKRPWRSAFGDVRRDIRSAGLNHSGLDLFANIGTNVFASLPGTVTTVDYQAGGAGHYIIIKVLDDYVAKFHELRRNYSPYYVKSVRNYDENKYDIKNYPDFIEQVGVTNSTEVHFMYMHLKSGSINVKKGEIISESDYKTKVIAQTGDSGASGTKGPHLHFEIRNARSGSKFNPAYYVNYKNETELTTAERQAQDTAAGK